jgi:hypothetical protein
MSNGLKKRGYSACVVMAVVAMFNAPSFAQDANTVKTKKDKDPATHVDYKSPPAPVTQTEARSTQSAQNTAASSKTKSSSNKVPADNHAKREMPF